MTTPTACCVCARVVCCMRFPLDSSNALLLYSDDNCRLNIISLPALTLHSASNWFLCCSSHVSSYLVRFRYKAMLSRPSVLPRVFSRFFICFWNGTFPVDQTHTQCSDAFDHAARSSALKPIRRVFLPRCATLRSLHEFSAAVENVACLIFFRNKISFSMNIRFFRWLLISWRSDPQSPKQPSHKRSLFE